MDNKRTVLAFSGFSGSGKTTLIEKMIPLFKDRGCSIAVIKHDAHDFEIDREGKDTWRFRKAGADRVYIASASKSARMSSRGLSLENMLEECADADMVFVEGYRNAAIKKIGVTGKDTGYELAGPYESFEAIVTDDPSYFDNKTETPVFDRDDVTAIVGWIQEKYLTEKKKDETLPDFTHFDDEGNARMVTVAAKDITRRTATAMARVLVNEHTFELIKSGGIKKGDVLTVAQIAGIMGAKRTPDLIPMCHPVVIDGVDLKLHLNEKDRAVEIRASVTCTGRTGVEMEAITACSVAALTVYDMCKAVQRDIVMTDICLLSKSGGVHGDYKREATSDHGELSVGILTGGKSSRMKTDKAFLDWNGQRLIDHLVKEMSGFSDVMISCCKPEMYAGLPCRLITDQNRDYGPLEGIRRLLESAACENVFICAVDMPFVTGKLAEFLKSRMDPDTDCILAGTKDNPEPLCAIYNRRVLPVIEEMIKNGQHRIRDMFDRINVRYADIADGGFSPEIMHNMNTGPEYEQAKNMKV